MTFKLIYEYSQDLNILYVEDDVALIKKTKELFENFFKTVHVAYNGKEGLDLYTRYTKRNKESYDLVISDINMPQMDGIEFSRNLLKLNPLQPIIILSAHNDSNYLMDAIDIGISAFLTKPMRYEHLCAVFYKISMAIYDHKYVQNHLKTLEELNLQLLSKNTQLEKTLRLLDTNSNKKSLLLPLQKLQQDDNQSKIDPNILRGQIDDFIQNDIFELKELLNEIDLYVIDIVENKTVLDINSQTQLITLFKKYSTILSMYTFLDELSVAMNFFVNALSNHPIPVDEDHIKNVFLILESFLYDLSKWHDNLLSGDESRINAFDASNIVNLRLLINMWTAHEEEGEVDLNSIFDF